MLLCDSLLFIFAYFRLHPKEVNAGDYNTDGAGAGADDDASNSK